MFIQYFYFHYLLQYYHYSLPPYPEDSTLILYQFLSVALYHFTSVANNSATTPPPPPSVSPAAPAMPDLVSDVSGGSKPDNRSAFLESIRKHDRSSLKKVDQNPKPKEVSSDGDFISDLHNTLERRRNGVAGEENSDAKPKKVVKQAPKLTAEEIARKKAENLARYATIREQNKKKWEEAAKKNEEIAREKRRVEAEAVKARIEQKRRERGETTENVVNGIDPALHHNIVTELRSEIASLREQLKNQDSSNLASTLGGGAEEPIYSEPLDTISIASSSTQYSEPWQDPDVLIGEALENEFGTSNTRKPIEPSAPPLSASSSSEDLNITESNTLVEEEEKALKILDEVLDDSSGYSSGYSRANSSLSDWSDASSLSDTDGYDTVYTSSSSKYSNDSSNEDDVPLSPPPPAEELAALDQLAEVLNPATPFFFTVYLV